MLTTKWNCNKESLIYYYCSFIRVCYVSDLCEDISSELFSFVYKFSFILAVSLYRQEVRFLQYCLCGKNGIYFIHPFCELVLLCYFRERYCLRGWVCDILVFTGSTCFVTNSFESSLTWEMFVFVISFVRKSWSFVSGINRCDNVVRFLMVTGGSRSKHPTYTT